MPWLVFTNLYVALCGAALTAASPAMLGLPPRLDHLAGLVFCCTLVIYNLDRLVEPHPGQSQHEHWVETHRKALWIVTFMATLGTLVFATRLSTASLISLPLAGIIAVGYCLPTVPYRGQWLRLKALPGAKLALIAIVWTYATLGLPILENSIPLTPVTVALLLARFFFIAAVALPFDLPDMQRDKQSQIATIPTRFGPTGTQRIAFGLIALSAIAAIFTPWPFASALLVSSVCVAGLLAMLRPDRGVWYFMVALDGMLFVQAGMLILISNL